MSAGAHEGLQRQRQRPFVIDHGLERRRRPSGEIEHAEGCAGPKSVWCHEREQSRLFAPDKAALQAAMDRKSVLDGAMRNFTALNGKLGAEDRAKLDNHLNAMCARTRRR